MNTSIRPYTRADRNACQEIFRSNIPKYFTQDEDAWFQRWLDTLDGVLPPEDGDGETHYFVLERDGVVLACGGWGIKSGRDHATLIFGMVHRDFLGHGIGQVLTEFRLADFHKAYPGMPITIDTSHHTEGFYARFGFVTERYTENGYGPGLHRHDMRLGAG
jgi:predicted GNAT family N-acyltransferase